MIKNRSAVEAYIEQLNNLMESKFALQNGRKFCNHFESWRSSPTGVPAIDAGWDSFASFAGAFQFNMQAATDVFNDFLADSASNQHLLPYLSLISTVLGTHTRNDELLDFLYNCCGKLEQAPDAGYPFSVFYNYVLAFGVGDETMIAHHGYYLNDAVLSISSYGVNHPSVVAGRNFYIWDQMHTRASSSSVLQSELRDCILRAEQTSGPTSLLAVNSVALLGRLLQEQSLFTKAAEVFTDAIARLESCPSLLQAYKLEMVQRLARAENDAGFVGKSGLLLLEVYIGRIQILGIDHAYTAGALQQLRDLLVELGKSEDKVLGSPKNEDGNRYSRMCKSKI